MKDIFLAIAILAIIAVTYYFIMKLVRFLMDNMRH